MNNLVKNHKQIYDCVHGFIWISNYACKIIDTPYFQRLKQLQQLGTCHYVYPTAIHSRFEHSIGTYYLAGRILKCISERTNKKDIEKWLKLESNLKHDELNDHVCELIKIAALCHDIGHGPFSHTFDDSFLPRICSDKELECEMRYHENRSCLMLETIIKKDEYLRNIISDDDIQFIKDVINPQKNMFGFVYQIVSNKLNDLDVDKYDYLVRDTYYLGFKSGINYFRLVDDVMIINNIICYPEQVYHDISGIFKTRYRLHKQVYCHKATISMQFMILDLMYALDNDLGLVKSITKNSDNLDDFAKLTDYVVLSAPYLLKNEKAIEIINRINHRCLYKSIGTIVSKTKLCINKDFMLSLDPELDVNNVLIHQAKLGYVSGDRKNPLDSIFFYNRKYPEKSCFTMDNEDTTYLVNECYQEYVTMIFSKSKNKNTIQALQKVFNVIKSMKKSLEI